MKVFSKEMAAAAYPEVFRAVPDDRQRDVAHGSLQILNGFTITGPGIGLDGPGPWWSGPEGQVKAQMVADVLNIAYALGVASQRMISARPAAAREREPGFPDTESDASALADSQALESGAVADELPHPTEVARAERLANETPPDDWGENHG